MNKSFLTKSRFQLANQCPAKLFYTGKKEEYADNKLEDSFLMELAKGGYQVGELAKCVFPGGRDIFTLDKTEALKQTCDLLESDEVSIYEAAIAADNLFIRADVLVKSENQLSLYEVKAKSFDSNKDSFLNKNGTIKAKWKPYLQDVAFQMYVIQKAYPDYEVIPHLMLVDQTVRCPVDGLNQKFRVFRDKDKRTVVAKTKDILEADLNPPILCRINVEAECQSILEGTEEVNGRMMDFPDRVNFFATHYSNDEKIRSPFSAECASCEFQASKEGEQKDLKDGRKECWNDMLGWEGSQLESPTILDIWNFRGKDKLIARNCIEIKDLEKEDFKPTPGDSPGMSASERRWKQVEKYQQKDETLYFDSENFKREMDSWVFPLHFIDFETCMAALPFNSGRHPYEGIAFQFSHHIVQEDGTVEHAGEYLNSTPGEFPNFYFMRELKTQLENDGGSIFRYGDHENTFLNTIYRQIRESQNSISDSDELCDFITTITRSVKRSVTKWAGEREMIDMCDLVKKYYYDPTTNGSNSIKAILPSILNRSDYLQNKYSHPIYGTPQVLSKNFRNHKWVHFEDGNVMDPYKLLPKMFQDVSDEDMDLLLSEAFELKDGGAAMSAYAKLQFEEMPEFEREEIKVALLKYCELDTMAMVMLCEGWRNLLKH